MKYGFYISKIWITGTRVETVKIEFAKGLNVVTGASDTGKSNLFEIIEFMLGKTDSPTPLDESNGYTDVLMEVRKFEDDLPITLNRKFKGKEYHIKRCEIEKFLVSKALLESYAQKHSAQTENNISRFFLKLSGIEDVIELKKDANFKKVSLSFSDIRKFTCIAEDKIIKKESPFYFSPGFSSQVKDQSFLNFILTGKDASGTTAKESKEIRTTRLSSKIDLLKDQLERKIVELEELEESNENGLLTVEYSFETLQEELKASTDEAEYFLKEKNFTYNKIEEINFSIQHKTELLDKFNLLKSHYNVDLERLQFVTEGDFLLSQLSSHVCPVCNQEIDENHIHSLENYSQLNESVNIEISKIETKLRDLEKAISNTRGEIEGLESERLKNERHYKLVNLSIEENLSPKINFIKNRLQKHVSIQNYKLKKEMLEEEIDMIRTRQDEYINELANRPSTQTGSSIPISASRNFVKNIEQRLNKWNYLGGEVVKVNFDNSYQIFDINISGKPRKSFGKGKRSVSYAACVIGILDFVQSNNRPFSNLVVLDSPLTTYEGKKKMKNNEDVELDIVNSFFKDLSKISEYTQVIILDNKTPSEEIASRINLIEFSGDNSRGRYGLYHVKK